MQFILFIKLKTNVQKRSLLINYDIMLNQVTYTYDSDTDTTTDIINMVVILELQAGQEVYLEPTSMNSIYGVIDGTGMYSWFSGHLVYAL